MSEQIEGDEGRTIAEPNDYDEGFPGLWVGHYAGDWDEVVEIQQFEEDDEISRNVFIQEEYLPEVIVALAERMPAEDVDHVIGQLEELEG